MQPDITHNSCNEHIIFQLFLFHQFQCANQHHLVTVKSFPLFIYNQTTVCITIVGNTNISTNLNYFSL